ncbi:hypothetical protein KC845_03175 [Candidatus Kaiserbacteria bacterium]|nr:hypothetical protein [Candidatus Kaiserbacteria bacterium]
MRVRPQELSNQERMETLDALYTAAGSIKGRIEAKNFLKDLLTESERIMLGRRILIARALLSGSTYDQIVDEFKVGKDTVGKISRWLEDQMPGYEQVISKMDKEFKKRDEKIDLARNPLSLNALKKKYPLHFLLFSKTKD